MSGIAIASHHVQQLAERYGGALRNGAKGLVRRVVPVEQAGAGELAPLLSGRYVDAAVAALARGAMLLIEESLGRREDVATLPGWFHPYAAWTLAELLESGDAPAESAIVGDGCTIGAGALLMPRVRLGARVTIGPGAVIGAPGFGFAKGPNGATRPIPHLGGVVIEDDVHVGALCTIAAGTLVPTVLRRGVKLDAQVHVAHNCAIGEATVIAAQTGIAGSVTIGRRVRIGGQVGIADHITIGDGAQIAAKSGVIGDVAAGATVAGYPAVARHRWLRGLAELYRLASTRSTTSSDRPTGDRSSSLPVPQLHISDVPAATGLPQSNTSVAPSQPPPGKKVEG